MSKERTPYTPMLTGCSDGYCDITGPRKGMHTNGGCHCIHNALRAVRDSEDDFLPTMLGMELKRLLRSLRKP